MKILWIRAVIMRLVSIIAFCFVLSVSVIASAQSAYSAETFITYQGVGVQLAGTQVALAVAEDSVFPIRGGDTVRTNETGRILIRFLDFAQVLLLPNTEYHLISLEKVNEQFQLEAEAHGRVIYQILDPSQLDSFVLKTNGVEIIKPADWFSVWDLDTNVVTVMEGDLLLSENGKQIQLSAGQGYQIGDEKGVFEFKNTLLNPTYLQAGFVDCVGIVHFDPQIGKNLLIRLGTGQGYFAIGGVQNGDEINLQAVSQDSSWYRIAFLNGFGWIEAKAVETDCANQLTTLPNGVEDVNSVTNILDEELNLMKPFYGSPAFDAWFYRRSS